MMVLKKIFVLALALIAVGVVANHYIRGNSQPAPSEQTSESETNTNTSKTDNPSVKTYTKEGVAGHNGQPEMEVYSCWTIIHDRVYDITEYTENHPGGESIHMACGTDGTEAFEKRPVGSGNPHSQEARTILEKYYIGDLQK